MNLDAYSALQGLLIGIGSALATIAATRTDVKWLKQNVRDLWAAVRRIDHLERE